MSTTEPRSEAFHISFEAAQAYEATFVPAFFAQWVPPLCASAGVACGTRVLDVACGTGIVARTAAEIAGPSAVVGVDLNEAMLKVARAVRPDIDWRQGDATALRLADRSFDVVLCQMAMMFFPDRAAAVGEMARVARPGGRVAVLVPSSLAAQPAYGPFVDMAVRHAGTPARDLLNTYFSCGDDSELQRFFEAAALTVTTARTLHGVARFPSTDALVETEVRSTPLAQRLTSDTYRRIREGAREVLAPFTDEAGRLDAPFECKLVVGTVGR